MPSCKKMHKDLNSLQTTKGAMQNLPSGRHSIPNKIVLLLGQLMESLTLVGGKRLQPIQPGCVGSASVGQRRIVTKGTLPANTRTSCSSVLTMKQQLSGTLT